MRGTPILRINYRTLLARVLGALLGGLLTLSSITYVLARFFHLDKSSVVTLGYGVALAPAIFLALISAWAFPYPYRLVHNKMRGRCKLLALTLPLGILVAAITMLWNSYQSVTGPSDRALIAAFSSDKPQLARLAMILLNDQEIGPALQHVKTITGNGSQVGSEEPYIKMDKYASFLPPIHLVDASLANHGNEVDLISWQVMSLGEVVYLKGYAMSKSRPNHIVANLDDLGGQEPRRAAKFYRHVEGDWYLFYEVSPKSFD